MKIFLPILFCFFLYFGCGNNTNADVNTVKKTTPKAEKKSLFMAGKIQKTENLF